MPISWHDLDFAKLTFPCWWSFEDRSKGGYLLWLLHLANSEFTPSFISCSPTLAWSLPCIVVINEGPSRQILLFPATFISSRHATRTRINNVQRIIVKSRWFLYALSLVVLCRVFLLFSVLFIVFHWVDCNYCFRRRLSPTGPWVANSGSSTFLIWSQALQYLRSSKETIKFIRSADHITHEKPYKGHGV